MLDHLSRTAPPDLPLLQLEEIVCPVSRCASSRLFHDRQYGNVSRLHAFSIRDRGTVFSTRTSRIRVARYRERTELPPRRCALSTNTRRRASRRRASANAREERGVARRREEGHGMKERLLRNVSARSARNGPPARTFLRSGRKRQLPCRASQCSGDNGLRVRSETHPTGDLPLPGVTEYQNILRSGNSITPRAVLERPP